MVPEAMQVNRLLRDERGTETDTWEDTPVSQPGEESSKEVKSNGEDKGV